MTRYALRVGLAISIMVMGMVGLFLGIDYSGWVLLLGSIFAIDCA